MLDRTQKKPHDYRVPAGQRRYERAFADSDRLTIEGERVSAAPEAGAAALAEPAPPIDRERAAAPGAAAGRRLLGLLAVPGACLVLGLVLGFVAGTVVTSEPVPVVIQHQDPAVTPREAARESSAAPDAQSAADASSAPQAPSLTPAQPEPSEASGR
jgi:hypothetical protein